MLHHLLHQPRRAVVPSRLLLRARTSALLRWLCRRRGKVQLVAQRPPEQQRIEHHRCTTPTLFAAVLSPAIHPGSHAISTAATATVHTSHISTAAHRAPLAPMQTQRFRACGPIAPLKVPPHRAQLCAHVPLELRYAPPLLVDRGRAPPHLPEHPARQDHTHVSRHFSGQPWPLARARKQRRCRL